MREAQQDAIAGEVRREGKLLLPRAALPRPAPTPGSYNCRLIKLGKATPKGKAYESFKPFFCYVEVEDDLLTIVKQTGSQRPGGPAVGRRRRRPPDLPRQPGARRRGAAARLWRRPKRNMAGVLERIAPFRWRLVIPWPQSTSKLDVFELTPVDFSQPAAMSDERGAARGPGGGARDPGRLGPGRARRSAIPKCWRCSAIISRGPRCAQLCKVLAYVDDEAEERGRAGACGARGAPVGRAAGAGLVGRRREEARLHRPMGRARRRRS